MNVTLFRDMPTEGWPSMERYADGLTAALASLGCRCTSVAPSRPFPSVSGRSGALLNHVWRGIAYPLLAWRRQGPINHILDHSYAHLLESVDPARTIVTVHDLAPLALDERGRGLSRGMWNRSVRALGRAARVVADSHFTRNELIRLTDYPAERATVVWLGVSDEFCLPTSAKLRAELRAAVSGDSGRILLHVGSCLPRKNVSAILEALPQLADPNVYFVQVGGKWGERERAAIERLKLQTRVKQIPSASATELRAWYAAADLFVFPSVYEGFGLPILEAMATGLPVICSRDGATAEIAGDAASMVDPLDSNALANAIKWLLADPVERERLKQAGSNRAQQFTWQRCAEQTLAVYRGLAEELHA